ncbi:DEDDh family exonuclease [Mycobacterium sp.]|uniref:DEDDh family exonuclease n=1 Tax=Mycobacterium sp. TaxID=1785 RepID=UPI002D5A6214|nr:DEDDh family exonuclease [Mycobacterium sp.]HZA11143.1 DEDDh family exonuclease [Mycobacterium sp.]
MTQVPPWGRPAAEHKGGWVVLDVETSGFRPGHARIISLAALALDGNGAVERSVVSLLNPGVDPGPTHVHGLTADMLAGQPSFADIVSELVYMLCDRTLVAHNAAFDYSFLSAEAELAEIELPIDEVMCTVELTRRLSLGTENLRLETLAAHWGISQLKPHDAFDDALVLSQILTPAVKLAQERDVWLPVRPTTRRRWPNGSVTHDELRPLKMLASRVPCEWLNPGRYQPGRPLVQGMRVALSAEVDRTHEELIERIMHVGLAYSDMIDEDTSVVICNDPNAEHGKGFHARELGVPTLSDVDFLAQLDSVVGGTGIEDFTDSTVELGEQFALF